MRHVTYRGAVSAMVIHSIFDVWQYEVLWTCMLTRLLRYAFDYVRSILYIILYSTKLPNAFHCSLPSKLSSHSQAHSQACSQVYSQLHLMILTACLTIYFQVSFQNTLKHSPGNAFKYTPKCTQCHTPILVDCTLPSTLSRCSQVHTQVRCPLHCPEARHSQSHLTVCSHVCSWVLDPETG
jgi:hypothetical protein